MGLFGNLLNKVVRDAKNEVEKSVANAVTQGVSNAFSKKPEKKEETAQETVAAPAGNGTIINGINYDRSYQRTPAHFRPILEKNFSQYRLEENVPMDMVFPGAAPSFNPASFVLKSGEMIVAVIAIMPAKKPRSVAAQSLCKKNQVAYVDFWCDYENTEAYVTERINKALFS